MRTSIFGWLCTTALFAGCAASPPAELLSARAEYARAHSGPAAQLAPAELSRASQALAQAEQAFADSSVLTRDLAYAATRESEVAESAARTAQDDKRRTAAAAEIASAERQLGEHAASAEAQAATAKTQAELSERARAQAQLEADEAARQRSLAESQAELSASQAQAAETKAQEERNARLESEAALKRVQQFASIRNEARGRVITLNGSILFTTGTAQLLPSARLRLDEVAQALENDRGGQFTVEGFTDARGSATRNLDLSEARAMAVRNYLVGRGVPDGRIRARGHGEEQPVATNATADGRANNRRVEIIISHRQAER